MKIYLDGQFLSPEDARLSVLDAAVQHGVGLFETMQAYGGKVFALDRHVQRLVDSAAETGLTTRLQPEALAELVEQCLAANAMTDARIRLTVTGGDLSLLSAARSGKEPAKHQPSICCVVSEPTQYPAAFFEQGVSVVVADPRANPFDPLAGHKTLNYWLRLKTLGEAAAAGAGEALWLTVTNHLAGGAVSNAFLVKDGQLLTPFARGEEAAGSIPAPVLPGITRSIVLDIAEQLDIPVHRRMLTIHDVLEADELLLTNSSWNILPVIRVERTAIGSGEPGPVTRQLTSELVDSLTG